MLIFSTSFLIFFAIKKKKLEFDSIFFALLIYSVFKLLSVFYATDTVEVLLRVIYWLNISVFYLSLKNLNFLKSKKDLNSVIFLSVLFNIFFALLQVFAFVFFQVKLLNIYGWFWPNGFRVTGLSYDANHLASFILIGFSMSLFFLFQKYSIHRKIIFASFLFLCFLTFYYSASRSSFIGLVFGLFGFFIFKFFNFKFFKMYIYSSFILIPLIFIGVFLAFNPVIEANNNKQLEKVNTVIYDFTKNFVKHGRGIDSSALAHFGLIYSSFYLAEENHFLGIGAGNFSNGIKNDIYLAKLFNSLDSTAYSKEAFPSHSMYGEALGEGGIIGIILFCSILLLIVNKYLKILKYDKSVFPFFIYFYSVLFFMLFYNINEEFFWVFTFLGLSLANRPVLSEVSKEG